jgi:nucleoside-diphosphate-sugar epimerase
MKAAISGQSGFIGTHLSSALLSNGFQVARITQELLYSAKDLREFFLAEQPDYIFHLAAYGNMAHQKDKNITVFSNILGTYNMLSESITIPYRAFINFGSSSEYGKKEGPMRESDALLPWTFYGASKAAASQLAFAFRAHYVKPIMTVRPFSVYGEGEAEFRLIPTVIRALLANTAFPLEEGANHDWIYIKDFIEALMLIKDKAHNYPFMNIGSGQMHTNKEICLALSKIAGRKYLATPFGKMRAADSNIWMADISQLVSLGWHPRHMLQEGLQKTYEYYKARFAAQNN